MRKNLFNYTNLRNYKLLYKPNADYTTLEKLKLVNFYMDYSTQNKSAKILWGLYTAKNSQLYKVEFIIHQYAESMTIIGTLNRFYTKTDLKEQRFLKDKDAYSNLTKPSLKDLD